MYNTLEKSHLFIRPILLGVLLFLSLASTRAEEYQANSPLNSPSARHLTISERVARLQRNDGFLPFYWDPQESKLLLQVSRPGESFLYVSSLSSGLGSVFPRLDRGMIKVDSEAVVRFDRIGDRVLLVQLNTKFRALETKNEALVRSVEESFPHSVLASFPIEAEDDGTVLIDATQFFLLDTFGVRKALRDGQQGDYRLDTDRSVIVLSRSRGFPRNTEIEAMLTFESENPGPAVQQNTPNPGALTLRIHHSLVALPDPGYDPRRFDPRVGLMPLVFRDYAQPFTQTEERRWIRRWRLEKRDPSAELSPVKKPLVYYLDRGIPEPVRSAIREGVLWWNDAFEAAGFKDAIQVRDLPPDADPMDVRYSVIQWVHRSEEGFANGPSLIDPRTGEIIKAMPRLHSDRTRTDSIYWAGLIDASSDDSHDYCGAVDWGLDDWVGVLDPSVTQEEFLLARIRQLAAHEVGHTLGLEHNFAASTYGRASVMDYPAPLVRISHGRLDLSHAYAQGIGEYDRFAIRYGYAVFPEEEEDQTLDKLVQEGIKKGFLFVSSRDSGLHPLANPWDTGSDPLEALRQALEVRRILLNGFGEHVVKVGEPLALLRARFLPVYLYHRFALEAATKLIGGIYFTYALRGDGQVPTQLMDPARQRDALDLVLDALRPENLVIPPRLLALMAPRPFGYESPAEPFDQLAAGKMLAGLIMKGLLDRDRAARLVAFADLQDNPLTLEEVIQRLTQATWGSPKPQTKNLVSVQRVTQRLLVDKLIELARDPESTTEVRGIVEWHLQRLEALLEEKTSGDPAEQAHIDLARHDIHRFLARADSQFVGPKITPPPAANLTSSH